VGKRRFGTRISVLKLKVMLTILEKTIIESCLSIWPLHTAQLKNSHDSLRVS
jgi:hypothetical protein